MKLLKKIVIICLIKLITCHILKNREAREGFSAKNRLCTKFGFICLNDRDFKICEDPSQIEYSLRDTVFECEIGFTCDENNPQFCTQIKCENCENSDNGNLKLLERLASLSDNELDDYDNLLSNLMEIMEETDSDENFDISFKTTAGAESYNLNCEDNQLLPGIKYNISSFVPIKAFVFYLDRNNLRMFWYCNKRSNGKIELVHMFCGMNQIYDPRISSCRIIPPFNNNSYVLTVDDLKGYNLDLGVITRSKRPQNSLSEDSPRIKSELFKKPYLCDMNVDGKRLKEDSDCHLYHICFDENYAPLKEVTFVCPDKTAFDPESQRCTTNAVVKYCKPTKPCKTPSTTSTTTTTTTIKPKSANPLKINTSTDDIKNSHIVLHNTICQIPFVFRESSDCTFYYICRFDKIYKMKCPPGFLFDDYTLMCLPKNKAHCIIKV